MVTGVGLEVAHIPEQQQTTINMSFFNACYVALVLGEHKMN